jgi:hypothetical protein
MVRNQAHMDNDEDIQLHELETIERNLESDQPPEHDAVSGFMVLSASGSA